MEEPKKETEMSDELPINPSPLRNTQQVSITSLVEDLDTRSLTEILMTFAPQERRIGHCIMLYLPATREPIELWNRSEITLGRFDSKLNYRPVVDLSEHHAAKLGVSRIHGEISYENKAYYVQDLESRNGTWVNKIKLVPGQKIALVQRDTLRLGHLMIQVGACQYD